MRDNQAATTPKVVANRKSLSASEGMFVVEIVRAFLRPCLQFVQEER